MANIPPADVAAIGQSPFSLTAARYREQGLAVMPCGPGTKFPGRYSSADGWRTAHDWQKYCERLPTAGGSWAEIDHWERWPDAGVCLALGTSSAPAGFQLVAADIDTEEPDEVAAIRSVLPGSPVRKRGAKGETEFYLAPVSVPNRPYNNTLIEGVKRRMLDLLGHGRQTVLPPTIHPDTGAAYAWTTLDTLEGFDVADLPVLPEDIADRLSAALAPFGHVDPPKLASGSADPDAEASTHRQLNDAALANLSAWVPALGLYKCRQVGGKYKAVSAWRPSSSGRPLSQRATNLAIGPEGIKDCGEGKGYTPIDLVMAACGADLDSAFRWLQDRVAPAAPIMLTAKVVQDDPAPEPEQAPARPGNLSGLRLATYMGEPVQPGAAEPAGDERRGKNAKTVRTEKSGILAPIFCTPPGLLGDIVKWMNSVSPVPSPQLNFSVAVAMLGTLCGRYYQSPTGARTNFYCMGVAKSGFGKSYPLKCANAIDAQANLERFYGPSGLKSDSALRQVLEEKNPVFISVDEVGVLLSKILNRRAPSHEAGIAGLLLDFFSSADDVYRGSDGVANRAVVIHNPHLCLSGMSTPSAFWGAFNTASAEHGLLPRMLIFDAGDQVPDEVVPSGSRSDVPLDIVKGIHRLLDARGAGNLAATLGGRIAARTVPYGDGAAELFDGIRREAKRRCQEASGLEELAFSRFAEHVIKLALLYAVGCDPVGPVITTSGLSWATDVVICTTRTLLRGAVDRVADNEYQADYKRVMRLVKEAGEWGLPERQLHKVIAGSIEKRRLDGIIGQLKDAGEIESRIGTGPRGGRPAARYFSQVGSMEDVG